MYHVATQSPPTFPVFREQTLQLLRRLRDAMARIDPLLTPESEPLAIPVWISAYPPLYHQMLDIRERQDYGQFEVFGYYHAMQATKPLVLEAIEALEPMMPTDVSLLIDTLEHIDRVLERVWSLKLFPQHIDDVMVAADPEGWGQAPPVDDDPPEHVDQFVDRPALEDTVRGLAALYESFALVLPWLRAQLAKTRELQRCNLMRTGE